MTKALTLGVGSAGGRVLSISVLQADHEGLHNTLFEVVFSALGWGATKLNHLATTSFHQLTAQVVKYLLTPTKQQIQAIGSKKSYYTFKKTQKYDNS